MMTTVSRCEQCGFDERRWSPTDVERTLAHADDLIGYVVDGWGAAAPSVSIDTARDPIAAVHTLMRHLDRLAAERRAADPFEPMAGVVAALHASDGGVPKRPIASAVVDAAGIVGDRQGSRQHHGRPWQALCLFSVDVIDQLAAEGHPIVPGSVGENVTIGGVDWSRLRGGLTIDIGDVRLRTSSPAAPCRKIGGSFADGDWNRIDHTTRPGRARWYASVIAGGSISPGDAVSITA